MEEKATGDCFTALKSTAAFAIGNFLIAGQMGRELGFMEFCIEMKENEGDRLESDCRKLWQQTYLIPSIL